MAASLCFLDELTVEIRLYWIWNGVRWKTGLTGIRLHDLRHSYATRAAEVGISMPVIARLLGHSTIWTTSRFGIGC